MEAQTLLVLKIYAGSGNFSSGSFSLYGVKKS